MLRRFLHFVYACLLLGGTHISAASTFPTILPPLESWHASSDGISGCRGPEVDYVSAWPGDSPMEVYEKYIAWLNDACRDYGNYTREFWLDEACDPDPKLDPYGFPPPGALGTLCKIKYTQTPKPDCRVAPEAPCYPSEGYITEINPKKICSYESHGSYRRPALIAVNSPTYGECMCYGDRIYVPAVGECVQRKDRYVEGSGSSCPAQGPEFGGSNDDLGNPINALKGFKRQPVPLGVGALGGSLQYDTRRRVPVEDPSTVFSATAPHSFGVLWHSSFHKTLVRQISTSDPTVQAGRGAGTWISFVKKGSGPYLPLAGGDDKLESLGSAWRYTAVSGLSQESYDVTGKLLSVHRAGGGKLSYAYSTSNTSPDEAPTSGLLLTVTDEFDRTLKFAYEQPVDKFLTPRIKTMTDASDAVTRFNYDAHGNLELITWPDDKVRRFVYEDANFPWALTGIVDESEERHSTYGYDTAGRAISTRLGVSANKYSTTWASAPGWIVEDTYDADAHVVWRDHRWAVPVDTQAVDPLGNTVAFTATQANGLPRLSSRSQPGGSGCNASSSELAYDSRGNVTSEIDFGRKRTCRAYENTRNFETVRVEGLSDSAADAEICNSNLADYQVPDNLPANRPRRKITTEWHRLWQLETRRAEPKRITTTVYNGEKDPLNGDQVLTCIVDGDPRLPDGITRLAVVCKRYEQATADETGNLGFNAPEIDKRSWSYTYNSYGQIKTETGPRGQQSYEYWPAPTAFTGDVGHWQGDLSKVTNALGQDTLYLEYNKRGQVLKIQHPNGSIEQRDYWPRGWLKSVTLTPAGNGTPEVTEYTYYATGLLKKATQPDGSWTFYTWDAAHRLVNVRDSADNTVDYVLDDLGNRESETYKGPQDALAKTITRTFDALGRMDSTKVAQ